MSKPKQGLTKQKLEAAELLGRGDMMDKDICKQIGISEMTLWRWERENDFLDAILAASNRYLASIVPKARGVLVKQANDKALPWLAHNAANSLLREHTSSKGVQAQQIVVTFGDAGLQPGIPAIDEVDLPED